MDMTPDTLRELLLQSHARVASQAKQLTNVVSDANFQSEVLDLFAEKLGFSHVLDTILEQRGLGMDQLERLVNESIGSVASGHNDTVDRSEHCDDTRSACTIDTDTTHHKASTEAQLFQDTRDKPTLFKCQVCQSQATRNQDYANLSQEFNDVVEENETLRKELTNLKKEGTKAVGKKKIKKTDSEKLASAMNVLNVVHDDLIKIKDSSVEELGKGAQKYLSCVASETDHLNSEELRQGILQTNSNYGRGNLVPIYNLYIFLLLFAKNKGIVGASDVTIQDALLANTPAIKDCKSTHISEVRRFGKMIDKFGIKKFLFTKSLKWTTLKLMMRFKVLPRALENFRGMYKETKWKHFEK